MGREGVPIDEGIETFSFSVGFLVTFLKSMLDTRGMEALWRLQLPRVR